MNTKNIRAEIKNQLGFTNRQVSVTKQRGYYDDCIEVNIKSVDAIKQLDEISKIVYGFENVSYDKMSDEILAGGNTYVRINIDSDVFIEVSKLFLDKAKEIFDCQKECVDIWNGLVGVLDESSVLLICTALDGKCGRNCMYKARASCKNATELARRLAEYNLLGKFIIG